MPEDHPTRPNLRALFTDSLGALSIRSGQILIVLILAAVAVFALIQLKLVVIPLLIATILAAAFSPVIKFLRRKLSPILATWITLLASVIVFGGLITLIVVAVRGQWDDLATSASSGIDQLVKFVNDGPIPIDQSQIDSVRDGAVDFLTSSQFGTGALAGVTVVGEFVTSAVLMIVILFFFLKDGDRIWAFFLRPFKGEHHERGVRIGHVAVRTLGGYVRGTATVAFVDAAAIGISVAIIGVPLALPLAVIVFISSFIPLIGATIAGILAALVALVANGPVAALVVVLVVIGVNQLEGNFLQPVVMAQSLKLHPLVILLALTAGTILGGIIGAVLSVPIAAVTWAIIKNWKRAEPEPPRKSKAQKAAKPTAPALTA